VASEAAPPETLEEAYVCGEVIREPTEIDIGLRQFRQTIDDAQTHFVADLHLYHLGRQAFTNPVGILQLKLNLSATLLNEVEKQQVREVLQVLVTRVRAQIQNLGHWRGSSSIIWLALFIAESFVAPQ
jgi:hypothetical protein